MNKINGSAKMKVSAENPATAHARDRCVQADVKTEFTVVHDLW